MSFTEHYLFDKRRSTFIKSLTSPEAIDIGPWYRYDTKLLGITVCESNDDGDEPTVVTDAVSIQIGVGNVTQTPASTATSSGKIGNEFQFLLLLGVAGITTLLNGGSSVRTTFELLFTTADGGAFRYETQVTINEPLLDGVIADPVAPEVALGKNEARGLYLGKAGIAGETKKWISQDGTRAKLQYLGNDNTMHFDDVPV